MLQNIRFALVASSLVASSLVASSLVACAMLVAASPMTPAWAQGAGDQRAPQQVAVTQAQIDGLIASQPEIGALQGKAPSSNSDQPDPKLQSKIEAIAKKHGFTGLEQYEAVTESIGIVMSGIDPETKSYVGPAAVIKKQIAQVQADKSMPAKDRKQALQELKEALSTSESVKPSAGNIEIVGKNFDKLSQAFQGTGGE